MENCCCVAATAREIPYDPFHTCIMCCSDTGLCSTAVAAYLLPCLPRYQSIHPSVCPSIQCVHNDMLSKVLQIFDKKITHVTSIVHVISLCITSSSSKMMDQQSCPADFIFFFRTIVWILLYYIGKRKNKSLLHDGFLCLVLFRRQTEWNDFLVCIQRMFPLALGYSCLFFPLLHKYFLRFLYSEKTEDTSSMFLMPIV